MRKLDPRIQKIWAIRYGAFTFAALVVSGFYELTVLLGARSGILPQGTLIVAVLVFGGLSTIAYPIFRYRFWSFDLTDQELRLLRGVFTRVFTVVPLRRIQHLDVSQTILEREFDLGKLVVYTAGTEGNRVVLPGLAVEEARDLRDRIKEYILEDAL